MNIYPKQPKLGFVHFCTLPPGRELLMHNFNSQEGVFKPILRNKITSEIIENLEAALASFKSIAASLEKS